MQQGPVAVGDGNRLIGRIMAAVDAEEAERGKARTRAAHEQLRLEGRPNGGRYYGYRRVTGDDGRPALVIDKAEAKVVRRMVDRLLKGYSISAVTQELNEAGYPTPRGGRQWRTSTVRDTVRRPSIAGLVARRDGEVVGPARWEPIIEPERWKKVMHVLKADHVKDARGRRWNAPRDIRGPRKWLLTGGLARCGLCGAALVVGRQDRGGSEPWSAYVCHKGANHPEACGRINISRAEDVEAFVVDAVLDFLDRKPSIAARLAAAPNPERAELSAELAELDNVIAKVSEELGAGDVDYTAWQSFHRPAKARADAIRARLAEIADPESVEIPPPDLVRSKWNGLTLRQRRAVLDRYVFEVPVKPRVASGPRPGDARSRMAERLELRWRR